MTFAIRLMGSADAAAGMRLCAQAGWNQTAGDWERLLAWEPEGCFVAERDGQVAGTVTTVVYGPALAWVGMLLVDTAVRRQGVGRALLLHALAWLEQARAVRTSALDATPLGKTLYERIGFADQFSLQRYEGTAFAQTAPDPGEAGVRRLCARDLPALATLDASAFGVDRPRVLESLVDAHPVGCHVLEREGLVQGYVCCRPGARTWYVGPLVAAEPAVAETLLRAALAPLAGRRIAVDVPDRNEEAVALVARRGLRARRPFLRMARGPCLPPGDIGRCYAIAGPEIG